MRFNYLEPATVGEAVSLLNQHGNNAKIMAGGTDLFVQMRAKAIKPEHIVDITYIPGLDYIEYDQKQGLRIGAMTTIREVERSVKLCQLYPILTQAASKLGSVAIRNVATIGGNLCNAAPSADTAPALIGLSANVKIAGSSGEKVVPLEGFCTGPGCTVCELHEMITEYQVPTPPPGTKGAYLKHSRTAIDLALVGIGVVANLESDGACRDIKVIMSAVAPTPLRAYKAEEMLKGNKLEPKLIEEAAKAASEEARPISDVRASAEYRKEIVKVLTRRAINQILAG